MQFCIIFLFFFYFFYFFWRVDSPPKKHSSSWGGDRGIGKEDVTCLILSISDSSPLPESLLLATCFTLRASEGWRGGGKRKIDRQGQFLKKLTQHHSLVIAAHNYSQKTPRWLSPVPTATRVHTSTRASLQTQFLPRDVQKNYMAENCMVIFAVAWLRQKVMQQLGSLLWTTFAGEKNVPRLRLRVPEQPCEEMCNNN